MYPAIYNSRNPEMRDKSLRRSMAQYLTPLFLLLLIVSQPAQCTDWRSLESSLAEKIAAVTGPGVIAVEVNNRSSLSAAEADEVRRAIIAKLEGSGVKVWAPDQAAAIIKITLSESLQNYVWVAQIQQAAGENAVAMVSVPRPQAALNLQNALPLTLRVTKLLSSPEPLLDVAVLEGNPRKLLVLTLDQVTVYDFKDGHWLAGQSFPINHAQSFPRDARGRIFLRKDRPFDVYMPGVICHSSNASPLSVNCSHNDDPWPLQTSDFALSAFFAPSRNFFTGALTPGIGKQRSAPAFYSAAAVPRDKYTLWFFAGVDRQLYLLDGINQQAAGKIHWGDVAGIHSDCRPEWQVLATSPEDEEDDWVQAFEFPDREPLAVSQKINFDGKISALWTAQDGKSATAIYRDAETGDYEAVQINPSCGQ